MVKEYRKNLSHEFGLACQLIMALKDFLKPTDLCASVHTTALVKRSVYETRLFIGWFRRHLFFQIVLLFNISRLSLLTLLSHSRAKPLQKTDGDFHFERTKYIQKICETPNIYKYLNRKSFKSMKKRKKNL